MKRKRAVQTSRDARRSEYRRFQERLQAARRELNTEEHLLAQLKTKRTKYSRSQIRALDPASAASHAAENRVNRVGRKTARRDRRQASRVRGGRRPSGACESAAKRWVHRLPVAPRAVHDRFKRARAGGTNASGDATAHRGGCEDSAVAGAPRDRAGAGAVVASSEQGGEERFGAPKEIPRGTRGGKPLRPLPHAPLDARARRPGDRICRASSPECTAGSSISASPL